MPDKVYCDICERIIDEESMFCQISDCPYLEDLENEMMKQLGTITNENFIPYKGRIISKEAGGRFSVAGMLFEDFPAAIKAIDESFINLKNSIYGQKKIQFHKSSGE